MRGIKTCSDAEKEGKKLPTALDRQQVSDLLYHAHEPFKAMLRLALLAGLRQGEILHLAKGDVRTDRILVRGRRGWKPKSHHERAIPLQPRFFFL